LEWTGHEVRMDQGRKVKNLRVNLREVLEGEDLN
jgi:hypothetical protein